MRAGRTDGGWSRSAWRMLRRGAGVGRPGLARRRRSSRWGTASSPARAGAGWAMAPNRSGPGRAPIAPPSAATAGACAYEPERVYGASEANGCHRSDVAPILSAPAAVGEKVNLACSGAKAANLWPAASGGQPHFGEPPQADRLAALARRDDVRMVVVTVGANDVGFGGLVAGCALDWARSSERGSGALPRRRPGGASRPPCRRWSGGCGKRCAGCGRRWRLPATGARTTAWWRWATRRRSRPGRWIRYPRGRLEPAQRRRLPGLERRCRLGGAARGSASIVAMMRRGRGGVGAEFLDLRHALDGHQLCDAARAGSAPKAPRPRAPSGFAASPSSRAPAASPSTPTPTASARSAPASASCTRSPAATTPATAPPAAATSAAWASTRWGQLSDPGGPARAGRPSARPGGRRGRARGLCGEPQCRVRLDLEAALAQAGEGRSKSATTTARWPREGRLGAPGASGGPGCRRARAR